MVVIYYLLWNARALNSQALAGGRHSCERNAARGSGEEKVEKDEKDAGQAQAERFKIEKETEGSRIQLLCVPSVERRPRHVIPESFTVTDTLFRASRPSGGNMIVSALLPAHLLFLCFFSSHHRVR
jgi:hypothetical protein